MALKKKIAFYAPLKSPFHPIPSGDREIARMMMQALRYAGYDVELISEVISYQKGPQQALFDRRRQEVLAEEKRIRSLWSREPGLIPDLWFTYHPYCKSPDWLGPILTRDFGIAYATAEACRTHQGSPTDWLDGRNSVREAVQQAERNFVLKDTDWQYLAEFMPGMQTAIRIRPFLDAASQPKRTVPAASLFNNEYPILFAAGMMRPGAKMQSYEYLAKALTTIKNIQWNLIIAGEGPERERVTQFFEFLDEDRLQSVGSIAHEHMFEIMDQSNLFVWPGIGEAIGLVFLEAQSRGLPVAALQTAGVPLVVSDGIGGLLSPQDDVSAYAASIKALVEDPALCRRLGMDGRMQVLKEHDIPAVAAVFKQAIDTLPTPTR